LYLISELFSYVGKTSGQLILKRISKIGVTRCQILRLKCTKFDFRWDSTPDPAGGAYNAPPDPLAVFKGPTSKGREEEKERNGRRKREGEGGEGNVENDLSQIPG